MILSTKGGFLLWVKDIVKYIINEYGVTSPNAITDAILPELEEWKNRPLQKWLPIPVC